MVCVECMLVLAPGVSIRESVCALSSTDQLDRHFSRKFFDVIGMVRSLTQWTKTLSFPSRVTPQKNTLFPPATPPKPDTQIYSDESEISLLGSTVRCIHHREGCQWTDELRKLKAHLNTCKYDAMPCTNQCGAQIPRVLMEDHIRYTCPNRRARCEFCGKDFSGGALEIHQGNCNCEPIYCENKCGQKVQKRHLGQHKAAECSKRLVACRYCAKEFLADTLNVHITKCSKFPVSCPNRCESGILYREDLDAHLKEKCISSVTSCPFKEAGCRFKGARMSLKQHMEENTEHHLSLLCSQVTRQNLQIQTLKTSLEKATMHCSGTLVWRISEFASKLAEARVKEGFEILSPHFLTSQYGYKLQASLFLNGNGAGEGSHLSVYIKILPGDYDPLLRWPFSHSVSFTLFDQTPEKACNIVESFIPDPSWENFIRPSNIPDALGFGFPRFLSHELLMRRQYIKDDVLFLRIKVDPTKNVAV